MRKLMFMGTVGGALLVALVGGSLAIAKDDRGGNAQATLAGWDEVPSISTVAKGDFRAEIDRKDKSIRYRLRYSALEGGAATAAHIHLGQRHTIGGVSAFLCGGDGKPVCPPNGGTVEGTLTAVDVRAIAAQGLAEDGFDELVRAIHARATYVNVHSTNFPSGEIRGQVNVDGDERRGRGEDDD